jgi:hypothetical protein
MQGMDDGRADASDPSSRQRLRSLRHQLLGKLLEIVLTPVAVIVESEVQVMSAPPKVDVLLLRRQGRQWSEEQRQRLPDGVRDRKARHHLLECKFSESVNETALQQALSYDYFYRQTHQLKAGELQTYVVSARTPRTALMDRFGYHMVEQPGVYVTGQPMLDRVVLLALNQLRDVPHNEFLRLFASRQVVRRQTIEVVARQPMANWPESFWALLFGLQRIYQLEETAMNREMTVEDVMEIGAELRRRAIVSASLDELSDELRKQAIANATPEERLAGLAAEERLAGLAAEERLAGLAAEERLAGLAAEERLAGLTPEERLAGLTSDEMNALMKQIESLISKQPATQPSHRKRSQR